MELVAWLTHKFAMHGFLWRWHKDHHLVNPSKVLQKNDYFFLVFAIPGILNLLLGLYGPYQIQLWIGLGITFYGLAYFLIHDVFIHRRIKWLRNSENNYFKAVRRAHKIHHKHLGKEEGECFGLLWVPRKFYK
jgi:beta-carotene 3-hydroxylase